MDIVRTAKNIMISLIEQAVETGKLEIYFSYKHIMEKLGVENEKLFHVSMQYLYDSGYLKFINRLENSDARHIEIKAKGIDFIEGEHLSSN